MDWSITLSLFNNNDPAFLPCWTDAAGWDCLFDQQLEDPATFLLQPSDSECITGWHPLELITQEMLGK